jgi:hypothetical protein
MTMHTCGTADIDVDDKCSFSCTKITDKHYHWVVTCPAPGGGTTKTSGVGYEPPHESLVGEITVSGPLQLIAATFEDEWGRPVTVPSGLKEERIRRRLGPGTPEAIAKELGLTLGPKKKR